MLLSSGYWINGVSAQETISRVEDKSSFLSDERNPHELVHRFRIICAAEPTSLETANRETSSLHRTVALLVL